LRWSTLALEEEAASSAENMPLKESEKSDCCLQSDEEEVQVVIGCGGVALAVRGLVRRAMYGPARRTRSPAQHTAGVISRTKR